MTVLQNIFVDESGYTGPNLLDSAQPVLAMASLCCDDAMCEDFKSPIFGDSKASEVKYSSLSKSVARRKMAIKFLRELAEAPNFVKVAMAHKNTRLSAKW